MNFGELIAKGSAIFLKKKLSAMQAVFDAGTAPEKEAFQASVLGDRAKLNTAQQGQQAAGATTALLNAAKTGLKDPAGGADIAIGAGMGPLQINAGNITAGTSALGVVTTFTGGGTQTAVSVAVTDTGSAADSNLVDLSVGGTSKIAVKKTGQVLISGGSVVNLPLIRVTGVGDGDGLLEALLPAGGSFNISRSAGRLTFRSVNISGFSFLTLGGGSIKGNHYFDSDVGALGGGANPLATVASNGTPVHQIRSAQDTRIFGSYTDDNNGRWVRFGMTSAGVASITPTGNGTGASGNVLHISGLPTSNPGPGILWNNAGAVSVGT